MPLCPTCLEALPDTLTCACGWQATLPVTPVPVMDEAALRALIRAEVARQLAEQQEIVKPRIMYPSKWGSYRAFGTGRS